MKITFYGAAGEVTGSCYHVQLSDGTGLLVDGGYFQGHEKDLQRNAQKLPIDWASIKYLILTHGHLDHCGRVPIFFRQGFRGRIIATAPTKDIAEIVWRDNLGLLRFAKNLANTDPFFTEEDIDGSLRLFDIIEYEKTIKLSNNASIILVDAGHILGSASVKISDGGESVVFSGDLGNWPMGVVKPTIHPGATDTVIIETTYGNRLHEDKDLQKQLLKKAIDEVVANKSTLLIPAFAIERSQELLRDFDDMFEDGAVPKIPVFLDSPMAIKVTALFGKYKQFLNSDVQKQYADGDDPFSFDRFKNSHTTQDSKSINIVPGPKIIIAGSGMMTGGRVVHHLKRVLPDPKSVLLIVGYQVPGTLGREVENARGEVTVENRNTPVRCKVEKIGAYSAHADQNQLLAWLGKFSPHPTKVFLTHGDTEAMSDFSKIVHEKLNIEPIIPKFAEVAEV